MEAYNYEYSVEQKNEGKWKLFKLLLVFSYILFAVAYFVVIYLTRIIPLGALIPLFLWILYFFTYRYAKPEYKYEISAGYLTFSVIYGQKTKRVKTKIHIKDALAILPLSEAEVEICKQNPKKTYSALPSKCEPDAYAMIYFSEDGECRLFLFRATADALKALKFYSDKVKFRKTAI